MGFLVSLLVFSFLIFFHELGHFIAARFFGVKVEVFSIGFGKRVVTKKIGDTQWSLSLIPLGGYIRMKGQDDSDPTKISYDDDSYNIKTPWQRIVISLAGPFANFFLAFLLYLAIAFIGVPKLLSTVGDINTSNPAYMAGMRSGDNIRTINSTPIHYWEDITSNIKQEATPINITVARDGEYIDFTIVPKEQKLQNRFGEEVQRYIIGIRPDMNAIETMNLGLIGSVDYAYEQTKAASTYIVQSVQKLITGLIPMENLGGVIGIVDTTEKVTHMGIVALLAFTALISVNLGVLNLLPIPALDGGHIMFNLYEMITNRTPNEEIMYRLTLIGWALLLTLMLLGVYNDINRLLG
ncbi:MAG TPA: RIP metalloprotease RseP [Campylobacterales bacterium]|nr:RIP metalloprotease RseP [Campylobacterales bacterium]